MHLQRELSLKPLAAGATHIRSHIGVRLLVPLQIGRLRKALLAVGTPERFGAGVRAQVHLHHARLGKAPGADRTLKRPFAGVHRTVSVQLGQAHKVLGAELALEALRTVCRHVHANRFGVAEQFLAHRTRVRQVGGVRCFTPNASFIYALWYLCCRSN